MISHSLILAVISFEYALYSADDASEIGFERCELCSNCLIWIIDLDFSARRFGI